ncbi:MAG: hypothetical protein A2V86_09345 [Deltaproteobacteria bacterium RBG_16_49_23]|nr:MAG: hypothetical protein A2V86_09345 [Deltaproteobacteria bacterium RBG_16_49_23]
MNFPFNPASADPLPGIFLFYPVRNNAPLLPPGQRPSLRARGPPSGPEALPPGQRPSLRGRSPSGAEPGPAAAAAVTF